MNYKITSLLAGLALTAHAAQPFPNYAEADLVLGQPGFNSDHSDDPPTASSLNTPLSVVVDPVTRKVFVADYGNNRILRFASAATLASGAAAEFVFGQLFFTTRTDSGSSGISPRSLFIDTLGRLWVADSSHNRVLMFNDAGNRVNLIVDKIFGQPDATTITGGTAAAKMSSPIDVCIDNADRLWVADYDNNRVLCFNAISSKASGAAAEVVLGQAIFTTNIEDSGSYGLLAPTGVTISSSGNLYVTCSGDNRVLRFDHAATLANGAGANIVLGQPNFATITSGLSEIKMSNPRGAWITTDDSLWVTDRNNNRLLRFSNASTKSSGAAADGVLGQPDFASKLSATTRSGLRSPYGKPFVDNDGRLWVADSYDNRVLRFTPPPSVVIPPVVPPVVVIDKTAPLLVLSTKIPKLVTKPQLLLKGTASDASGIKSVQYRLGSAAFKTATGTTAWQIKLPLKKGKNTVTLTATDTAGNISQSKLIKINRK
jgi:DNA-binding beta-propeller fold protein YncE